MLPHILCDWFQTEWKENELKIGGFKKCYFFHIHQFSILKKLLDLAHGKLMQKSWMWLNNLYGCQAVLKKVISELKCIFSLPHDHFKGINLTHYKLW